MAAFTPLCPRCASHCLFHFVPVFYSPVFYSPIFYSPAFHSSEIPVLDTDTEPLVCYKRVYKGKISRFFRLTQRHDNAVYLSGDPTKGYIEIDRQREEPPVDFDIPLGYTTWLAGLA